MTGDTGAHADWKPGSGSLLVVCQESLEREDFKRLADLLERPETDLRWARRAGRLVLLVEGRPGDTALVEGLSADAAVDYVLRDPSAAEVRRIFSRRDLLKVALATTGLMAAGVVGAPLALYLQAPAGERSRHGDVFVSPLDRIPVGGSASRVIDDEDWIIVRRDETHLHALSATCTHSGSCLVEWDKQRGQLICPCHHGVFDVYGSVVSGPPPRPLASREVVVREGGVYVKGDRA
jgi:Rieske Fe-S protein